MLLKKQSFSNVIRNRNHHLLGVPMQAFTHFSKHAFDRIAQRTQLRCEDIARILDRKLALNTGRKPGLNRNHLLFYSIPDDDFFVAIQDELTGTIVTVLPLDYHANLAWNISSEDCASAKALCMNAAAEHAQSQRSSNATTFFIHGHFIDAEGNQKTTVLQTINSAAYKNDLENLLSDQSVFSKLEGVAAGKGIDIKKMFGITIRLGKKGTPRIIDLKAPPPNQAFQWPNI